MRFCFTIDAQKGKIRFKIRKNRFVGTLGAILPPQVKAGIISALKAVERGVEEGERANIFRIFHVTIKVLTTAEDKTGDRDTQDTDDTHQYRVISPRDEILPPSSCCQEFFSALSALDLKIRSSSMSIGVEIRKIELLAVVRRKTVILDADRSLKFQEPSRAFLRRDHEIKTAITALETWVQNSCDDFRLWKHISYVINYCQKVSDVKTNKL